MATKKQIPRKHSNKLLNNVQENIVKKIQNEKGHFCSWLEAKHEYFEEQSEYDNKRKVPLLRNDIADQIVNTTEIDTKKISEDFKKKRSLLKLKETKLGVTIVLSLKDCQAIGFTGEELTKEVVDKIRVKLGLFTRKRLAEERKKDKESQ